MVEHSTADREVPGSNPGVPLDFATLCCLIFVCTFVILHNDLCTDISAVFGSFKVWVITGVML